MLGKNVDIRDMKTKTHSSVYMWNVPITEIYVPKRPHVELPVHLPGERTYLQRPPLALTHSNGFPCTYLMVITFFSMRWSIKGSVN